MPGDGQIHLLRIFRVQTSMVRSAMRVRLMRKVESTSLALISAEGC